MDPQPFWSSAVKICQRTMGDGRTLLKKKNSEMVLFCDRFSSILRKTIFYKNIIRIYGTIECVDHKFKELSHVAIKVC